MVTSVFKRFRHSRFVRIDPADQEAVAWAKARIARLYAEQETTPVGQIKSNRRFCELEIVFAYYFRGAELPDDDAGRDCLYIAACHLWHLGRKCGPDAAIRAWARTWTPWCGPDELAALIERVEANPRKWIADELAVELGLPIATRDALGLTTIGGTDLDKVGRAKRRKDRRREERAQHRRKNGAVTRAEYLAQSKSRTKPWLADGVSRSTWERRRRAGTAVDASPCTAKIGDILVYTDLRHVPSVRVPDHLFERLPPGRTAIAGPG
jgi:hypothetical protein